MDLTSKQAEELERMTDGGEAVLVAVKRSSTCPAGLFGSVSCRSALEMASSSVATVVAYIAEPRHGPSPDEEAVLRDILTFAKAKLARRGGTPRIDSRTET